MSLLQMHTLEDAIFLIWSSLMVAVVLKQLKNVMNISDILYMYRKQTLKRR